MEKPLVVCGMDFSGTSLVAGMLHAAGIDMGDVESPEDVRQSTRPLRYRLFEDRALQDIMRPYLTTILETPEDVSRWVPTMFTLFQRYLQENRAPSTGRWGVKNNALTFLTLHPQWKTLPIQWITTLRPLEHSMASAFHKLGYHPRVAAFLGVQHLAYRRLLEEDCAWEFFFDQPEQAGIMIEEADRLWRKLGSTDTETRAAMINMYDPEKKGVVEWQPSGSHSQA